MEIGRCGGTKGGGMFKGRRGGRQQVGGGGCQAFSEHGGKKMRGFDEPFKYFLEIDSWAQWTGSCVQKGKMWGFLTRCCNTLLLQATVC